MATNILDEIIPYEINYEDTVNKSKEHVPILFNMYH